MEGSCGQTYLRSFLRQERPFAYWKINPNVVTVGAEATNTFFTTMSRAETGTFLEPKSPKICRISSDVSMRSMDSDRPVSFQSAIRAAESLNPKFNYSQLWKLGFYLKIAQLVLTIACIVCYSSGVTLMMYSIYEAAFPYVVYFTYLIINCVIILSYLLRQKMPELLIRIFGLLGGILFTVAAGVTARICAFPFEMDEAKQMLIAQVILALLNAILYFLDTGISYHKSLHGIFTS